MLFGDSPGKLTLIDDEGSFSVKHCLHSGDDASAFSITKQKTRGTRELGTSLLAMCRDVTLVKIKHVLCRGTVTLFQSSTSQAPPLLAQSRCGQ